MNIYVAGKLQKKELILDIYRKLEALGHTVAYNWTTHIPIKPYDEHQDIAKQYSENEIRGIAGCDVFIYMSDEKGTTLFMEFGAALILAKTTGKPIVYAVGEYNNRSPWFFNPTVKRRDTIDQVLKELDPAIVS